MSSAWTLQIGGHFLNQKKKKKIISILVDLEFLTLDVWSILNLNQLDEEPLMSSFLLKKY